MPDERSNRVEVELRLLRDKNLEMLQGIIDKFETQVKDLVEKGIKIQGAAGIGETAVASHASTPSRVPLNSEALRARAVAGGGGVPPVGPPTAQAAGEPSVKASRATTLMGRLAENAFGRQGTNQYLEAQFRTGQIPSDTFGRMQYMSYLSEKLALKSGGGYHPGGRQLEAFSGALGYAGERGRMLQQSWQSLTGLVPIANVLNPRYRNQMAQYGVNVGESGGGGFMGTGWGLPGVNHIPVIGGIANRIFQPSAAVSTGMMAEWNAYKRSRWTRPTLHNLVRPWNIPGMLMGDPNYTSAQSQEATQITNQYGWTGPQQDLATDMMKKYTKRYKGAIGQEQVMQLLEPALRYGTTTTTEVENALNGLAQAASDANMNVKQFAEQMPAAIQAVSQAVGISGPTAQRQIQAYVSATGRSPAEAAAVLSNTRNRYLGMGILGMDPYQAAKNVGRTATTGMFALLGSLGDYRSWKGLKPGSQAYEDRMVQLQILHDKDPSLLGGMTPDEWVSQMRRAAERGVSAPQLIHAEMRAQDRNYGAAAKDTSRGARARNAITSDLRLGGVRNPHVIAGVLQAITTGSTHDKTVRKKIHDLGLSKVDTPEDAKRLVEGMLGGRAKRAANKAAIQVSVKAPYDKIFTAMINNHDKSKSNGALGFARQATGGLVHATADLSQGNVGGAIHDVWRAFGG